MPKRIKHPEHDIQVSCVRWFGLQYPRLKLLLFAIPNGARLSGNARQRVIRGARLKAEGMTKGVADLFLSVPSGEDPGLYIEVKSKTGRQSADQKEFQQAAEGMGYRYEIVRDVLTFQRIITQYLNQ